MTSKLLISAAETNAYSSRFALCCAIDDTPRLYVELVLWVICARRHLPVDRFHPIVYLVGDIPKDLEDWLRAKNIALRHAAPVVESSPHSNKIAPFLDGHESDCVITCDVDLFFVADPSSLLTSKRFRAPPNNHCNPPPHIFERLLSVTGIAKPYRPGIALYKGAGGMRETHINNISGGLVAAPAARAQELGILWKKWALWLVKNQELLGPWAIHVDQIAFALSMEEMREDVEFLPPQVNTVLHLLNEIATVYAFHLTSGHIPKFPDRFNADRTLKAAGVAPGVSDAINRLNDCIREAVDVLATLPSTRKHLEKFLNPAWRR